MQAASRESVASATDVLNGYTSDTSSADLTRLGEDLLAVAGVLAGEAGLRRSLADPSWPGSLRRTLLTTLFGERVSAPAAEVLGVLVEARWSATSDLLDATELLGVEALLAAADRAGDLGDVEDALFRFRQLVAARPQLAGALGDTTATADRRRGLVRDLLTGKAGQVTIRLAELAVAGFGGRSFDDALIRLVELAAARRERQLAYVTVAAPLSEADEEHLAAALSRMYGRQVAVRLTVDPELIGGIRVKVGYDLFDGSVLRRLNDARGALVGRR